MGCAASAARLQADLYRSPHSGSGYDVHFAGKRRARPTTAARRQLHSQHRAHYRMDRNTIMSLLVKAGDRCQSLMVSKIQNLTVKDVEADEIWGFVGKKEGHKSDDDGAEVGDAYCFIGMERTRSWYWRGTLESAQRRRQMPSSASWPMHTPSIATN